MGAHIINTALFFVSIICISICYMHEKISTDSGLKIEPIGDSNICGRGAQNGSVVSVHYTGSFVNGTKFDPSFDRNKTLVILLGECPATLIKGWVEGIQGMCVGENRKLIIPPHLGYGTKGKGVIPGNTTLHFDIILMDLDVNPAIKKLQEIEEMFNCRQNNSQ